MPLAFTPGDRKTLNCFCNLSQMIVDRISGPELSPTHPGPVIDRRNLSCAGYGSFSQDSDTTHFVNPPRCTAPAPGDCTSRRKPWSLPSACAGPALRTSRPRPGRAAHALAPFPPAQTHRCAEHRRSRRRRRTPQLRRAPCRRCPGRDGRAARSQCCGTSSHPPRSRRRVRCHPHEGPEAQQRSSSSAPSPNARTPYRGGVGASDDRHRPYSLPSPLL
jgi:hypothetical protein